MLRGERTSSRERAPTQRTTRAATGLRESLSRGGPTARACGAGWRLISAPTPADGVPAGEVWVYLGDCAGRD